MRENRNVPTKEWGLFVYSGDEPLLQVEDFKEAIEYLDSYSQIYNQKLKEPSEYGGKIEKKENWEIKIRCQCGKPLSIKTLLLYIDCPHCQSSYLIEMDEQWRRKSVITSPKED